MTVFLIFVLIGLLALLYIFCCVTRECWKCRQKNGTVEMVLLARPRRIDEVHRSRNPRSERFA